MEKIETLITLVANNGTAVAISRQNNIVNFTGKQATENRRNTFPTTKNEVYMEFSTRDRQTVATNTIRKIIGKDVKTTVSLHGRKCSEREL